MSYLDRIRLVFYGDFQADVSTVNNDVRHFDNTTFEPRFQDPAAGPVENGWWHPNGSNAFRLIGCRVRAVHLPNGSVARDAGADVAVGMHIIGSDRRVSGKIVDLDPQWQLCSQLWGLEVGLSDPNGELLMRSKFEPAGFRDILFRRQVGAAAVNGQGASSVFQSVLTDVEWAATDRVSRSRFLTALRDATANNRLSVRLTTFGYFTRSDRPRFTLGTVSGVIGPSYDNEPRSFVASRRFAPQNGDRTAEGVNFFDARLDEQGRNALVDLSNAFPLTDPYGAQMDLGVIEMVALADDGISEGAVISDAQTTILGHSIHYRDANWIADTGGIVEAPLAAEQIAVAKQQPWALIVRPPNGALKVLIRETRGGFHLRAEEFVQRADAGQGAAIEIFATTFGAPLPNAEVLISLMGALSDQGGGNPNAPQQPAATIPDINVPADAIQVMPSVRTDARGRAAVQITSTGLGEPRGYLDGQVYLLRYILPDAPALVQHPFDFIVVHLRSSYDEPASPNWVNHIAPILSQYGNLYPIMSERIVDLSDYESVKSERAILQLAFSLPIGDPNYMPVTRDLSASKQRTLLRWLTERDGAGYYILRYSADAVQPAAEFAAHEAGERTQAMRAGHSRLAQRFAAAQLAKGAGERDHRE